MKPFLKWVGGKRQLLPEIKENLPKKFNTYFEPFVGGGAVFFELKPQRAVINDLNIDLVCSYESIRDNLQILCERLDLKKEDYDDSANKKRFYYDCRASDRSLDYKDFDSITITARFIFLNKTCFNGLCRYNQKGEMNMPFGNYRKDKETGEKIYLDCPNLYDYDNLKAISDYLNKNEISILNEDFENILKSAKKGDFVYLDPPYLPVSGTSNFSDYVKGGKKGLIDLWFRLADVCKELDQRGVYFLLSSSAVDAVKQSFKDFNIIEVKAKRSVNSKASKRGKVGEFLIKNY